MDAPGIRPPHTYAIGVRDAGDAIVFTLEGEFDLAAAPAVRERLDAAVASPVRAVVFDLELVGFVDSSALREMLRADAALRAEGRALILASVPPPVARLLELTRTTDILTLAPTVEQALKRLAEPA